MNAYIVLITLIIRLCKLSIRSNKFRRLNNSTDEINHCPVMSSTLKNYIKLKCNNFSIVLKDLFVNDKVVMKTEMFYLNAKSSLIYC